jgi:hypothetical protein
MKALFLPLLFPTTKSCENDSPLPFAFATKSKQVYCFVARRFVILRNARKIATPMILCGFYE